VFILNVVEIELLPTMLERVETTLSYTDIVGKEFFKIKLV